MGDEDLDKFFSSKTHTVPTIQDENNAAHIDFDDFDAIANTDPMNNLLLKKNVVKKPSNHRNRKSRNPLLARPEEEGDVAGEEASQGQEGLWPGRQAGPARTARYRCYLFVQVHSAQVRWFSLCCACRRCCSLVFADLPLQSRPSAVPARRVAERLYCECCIFSL